MAIKPTTDSLLLAAACPLRSGDRLLDVGAGDGSVALLALARMPEITAVGLEVQAGLKGLAEQNAEEAGFAHAYRQHQLNILDATRAADHNAFDCVATNPPFFSIQDGLTASSTARQHARNAEAGDIDTWLVEAFKYAKPKGFLACIWPSVRFMDLTTSLQARASHVFILPIRFRADAPANRVLVLARKGHGKTGGIRTYMARELAYHDEVRTRVHDTIYYQKQSLWRAIREEGCPLPTFLQNF